MNKKSALRVSLLFAFLLAVSILTSCGGKQTPAVQAPVGQTTAVQAPGAQTPAKPANVGAEAGKPPITPSSPAGPAAAPPTGQTPGTQTPATATQTAAGQPTTGQVPGAQAPGVTTNSIGNFLGSMTGPKATNAVPGAQPAAAPQEQIKYFLWGFIDKTGQIVIKPQFQDVRPFAEGLAGVKERGSGALSTIKAIW